MKPKILTDDTWKKLHTLLKADPRAYVGAEADCRRFVEAVIWVTRSGAPWRLLPTDYGAWNTIYKRYARWCEAGVWERLLSHLTAEADLEYVMLDSTTVKAHACAANATKKGEAPKAREWDGDARA